MQDRDFRSRPAEPCIEPLTRKPGHDFIVKLSPAVPGKMNLDEDLS